MYILIVLSNDETLKSGVLYKILRFGDFSFIHFVSLLFVLL